MLSPRCSAYATFLEDLVIVGAEMVRTLFNILMLPFVLVMMVLALFVVVILDSLAIVGVIEKIDWDEMI